MEKFYLAEKNRVLLGDDVEVYVRLVGKPQGGLGVVDPKNEIWFGWLGMEFYCFFAFNSMIDRLYLSDE